MPEICFFQGIRIYVYHRDHAPPHIHVHYVGDWALLVIETGRVYAGRLPRHTLSIVRHWMRKRRAELREAWDIASEGGDPPYIAPPKGQPRRRS